MHIEINDNTRLREIQKVFSNYYPFLSLTFYHGMHKPYEKSEDKKNIDADTQIGEIRKTHISTLLEIKPDYKVKDIEREFQERIGISVQVMMREKGKWVQSIGLDMLNIKDINLMSRNASDAFLVKDYDEGFEQESELA
jgi:uncharacterized iron-regulated protein